MLGLDALLAPQVVLPLLGDMRRANWAPLLEQLGAMPTAAPPAPHNARRRVKTGPEILVPGAARSFLAQWGPFFANSP